MNMDVLIHLKCPCSSQVEPVEHFFFACTLYDEPTCILMNGCKRLQSTYSIVYRHLFMFELKQILGMSKPSEAREVSKNQVHQ